MHHFHLLIFLLVCNIFYSKDLSAEHNNSSHMPQTFSEVPQYLYKILSLDDWMISQSKSTIHLSEMDQKFIHLSTEEQIPNILKKFFNSDSKTVILKLDSQKLPGKLVKERNPGGTTEYFHLYNGSIPIEAVVSVKHSST